MSSALLKKLALATVLLLLAWAFYMYRQVPHTQSPFAKATPRAEQILLEQGPRKVELRKQGGIWKVASGTGSYYLADENPVKTLLSGLQGLQVEDEISDRIDRAKEYDVTAASGTHVTLLDAKGSSLAEGIFGKQAPDMAHIYFRYNEKPNVYIARGLIRGELGGVDVNPWRNRQLIDIPEAKIQGILIEGKGFKTDLVRASTETWTLAGKPIDPAPVNALIGTLSHLKADDFVDPASTPGVTYEGLTYAHLVVKGIDRSADLRIGPRDTKSVRYAISAGKDQGVAWISQFGIDSILKKPTVFKPK